LSRPIAMQSDPPLLLLLSPPVRPVFYFPGRPVRFAAVLANIASASPLGPNEPSPAVIPLSLPPRELARLGEMRLYAVPNGVARCAACPSARALIPFWGSTPGFAFPIGADDVIDVARRGADEHLLLTGDDARPSWGDSGVSSVEHSIRVLAMGRDGE